MLDVGYGRITRLHALTLASMEAERGRFVPWIAVAMMAGVLVYFALRFEPPLWVAPVTAGLATLGAALMRQNGPARFLFMLALAASAGFASARLAAETRPGFVTLPSKSVTVSGVVAAVDIIPGGRRVLIDAPVLAELADRKLGRQLRIRLRANDQTEIQAGDHIRLRALLRTPAPPAYPGAWDTQRDAYFAGLGGAGFALGRAEVLAHGEPDGIGRRWRGFREAVQARILAVLPGTEGAIAATLATGFAQSIPETDRAAFRDSGLAHLLAVAGLHIGAVMLVMMLVVRAGLAAIPYLALRLPCKQIAAGAALAGGFFYLALTGGHVPIMRSFAMAALVTLGIMVGRRALSLRGLALAAVVIMLIAPQEVPGVSFQMSFSAVLALIAGYEVLRPVLMKMRGGGIAKRFGHHLILLATTSILAGTASLPYGAYHFGVVQIYYVLSNMIAVPITSFLVMPAGLAALLLMPLGLEHLALAPMGWGIDLILNIAHGTAHLPAATLHVPPMPPWGLAVLSLGIAWLGLWRSRLRLAGIMAIALGIMSPAFAPAPDLLISADARLIAFRTGGTAYMQNVQRDDPLTLESWRHVWPGAAWQVFPARGGAGGVECGKESCLVGTDGVPPVLLWRGGEAPDCARATLLIAAEPAEGICRGLAFIDRFTVWRQGAHAVWLEPDGPRIVSDRDYRGARKWNPRPEPKPVPTNLPLAPSE